MPDLSELFGEERLTYAELTERMTKAGVQFGDVGQALGEARAEFARQLNEVRRSAALDRELDRAKVRNRAIVSKIIDMDRVTVGEDGVAGIAEQIDALRHTDPYLFEPEMRQPEPTAAENPGSPGTPGTFRMRITSGYPHAGAAADPDSMSDAEYYRAIKKL